MEERNWKYKITSRTGLVVAAVMLALFGGVTFWLYTVHNGAFILVGCIAALTAIAFLLSVYSALFFKVFVDKDGFYFQTSPGNGRYYRYSDILDCRLVESQRQYGSRYNRGRIRKTYYFYDLKFIDSSHQTHRLPYNKSLYEGEIDELVARIERAREDGE